MENLAGKRLLILGSTALIAGIVRKAKSLGVYTIVTDNRPFEKAPAKQIADVYYNIDFSDIAAIKKLVEEERIDGVLTGFTDSYIDYYLKICEATGLPCYGGRKQFEIATDKAAFKRACMDAGVPVIPGEYATNKESAFEIAHKIGFPVMIKPVDNSGSRGVIKCSSNSEFETAFEYAMSFSAKKMVIVEKYMDCTTMVVSYFMSDGVIRLSSSDDSYRYRSLVSGSSMSTYSEYPSRHTERYLKDVNDKVIRMLKANNFSEGVAAFQMFVDDDSFYFCEMCYRFSGGRHYYLVERLNGIDQLGLVIEFAVTGHNFEHWEKDKETPWFPQKCAKVSIIGKPGEVVAKVDGFEELEKDDRVIMSQRAKSVGDVIGKDGTTAQIIGIIQFLVSYDEDPRVIANDLLSRVSVENENGESIAFIYLY